MTIAFVVGNGTSRSSINLEKIHKHGTMYGCNALYRDYTPDFLIAVDTKMILELNKHNIQSKMPVWTNPNRAYNKMTGLNYFNPSKGWSSGPTALWMASHSGYQTIYILGFDYMGLGNDGQKVNNIYADSFNYKKSNERATYYGNWLKQTVMTCQKFPKKRYIRVYPEHGFVPKDFTKLSNLEHMTIEDFKKIFEKTPDV